MARSGPACWDADRLARSAVVDPDVLAPGSTSTLALSMADLLAGPQAKLKKAIQRGKAIQSERDAIQV